MRREMSHRKAKGRSIAALMQKENDDDLEEPPEFADDDDNDWTPNELKVVIVFMKINYSLDIRYCKINDNNIDACLKLFILKNKRTKTRMICRERGDVAGDSQLHQNRKKVQNPFFFVW